MGAAGDEVAVVEVAMTAMPKVVVTWGWNSSGSKDDRHRRIGEGVGRMNWSRHDCEMAEEGFDGDRDPDVSPQEGFYFCGCYGVRVAVVEHRWLLQVPVVQVIRRVWYPA